MGADIPSQEEVDRFDAACKERAGKALDEARAAAEQNGISAELLHVPNAHPATAIIETAKSRGCDLIVMASRHGLSWASRPQEAILGEPNIGGPSSLSDLTPRFGPR
jgi:nucleotide-binding universal stress UspA family protein